MQKLRNIIEGWYRRLFKPLNEHEKRRLTICENCEKKEKLVKNEYYCSICGCPIKSKIRSPHEVCALNKW